MTRPSDAGYRAAMDTGSEAPRVSTVGYAIGVGVATMAIVGSVVHFAFPSAPDWAMFAVAFAGGSALGAWRARARALRHGEVDDAPA